MKLVKDQTKINRTAINIHIFDEFGGNEKPEDFASMIENDEVIGFAGFSKRKHLKSMLKYYNVRRTSGSWVEPKDVIGLVKRGLTRCIKEIPLKEISVFIFPTDDNFIKEKMEGVAGACLWKNTALVFIHKDSKLTNLPKTVVHEYCHAYSLNFIKRETLKDHLVFEGMAENFVMSVIGGGESPWVNSLNRKESMRIFQKLRKQMSSRRIELYKELFFGEGDYPLWAGYSIGYRLVSDCLRKTENKDWSRLLRIPSDEVISHSGWLDK